MSDIQGDAEKNRIKSSLVNAQKSLERYKLKNGQYPGALEAINVPGGGHSYSYLLNGSQNKYTLYYRNAFALNNDDEQNDYFYVDSSQSGIQVEEDSFPTLP